MSRSKSRENAYLLICEYGYDKYDSVEEMVEMAKEEREIELDSFGKSLFDGVVANVGEIDGIIEAYSKKWSSSRIGKAALAALRLAIYEVKFTDTSDAVAINEAVELTKKYDSKEAASFINGILGSVVKER